MVISVMQAKTSLLIEADVATVLARLQPFLTAENIQLYLVGGYVRDSILGKASHDVDLAISGDFINQVRQIAGFLGGRFVLLDKIHQIARVVLLKNDTRWHLDFAALKGSIENDLLERDFSINAIALNPKELQAGWNEATFIDPLNGIYDLNQAVIRCTNDNSFRDDPARILRAFRFEVELGFTIDTHTESLITRDSALFGDVSGERVREELGRILETSRTAQSLRQMDRLGFLDYLVPEISACRGTEQPQEHFWNVFDHTIETVAAVERLLNALEREDDLMNSFSYSSELAAHFQERVGNGMTRKALIKLAALLHDIAKPQTKGFDEEKGRIRFLGHAQQGADIAEGILERLRFSRREKELVTRVIHQHLRPGHLSNAPQPPTPRAVYRYFRDNSDAGIDILFLSLADHLATRGPALDLKGWRAHLNTTEHMLSQWFDRERAILPPKLIDGHTLMEHLGLPAGPQIGQLLEAVREAQAAGEIQTIEDALDFTRKELDKYHANSR